MRPGRAISDYNRSIAIKPHWEVTYNNRGGAFREKGHFTEAVADFNKAIEINPHYAEPYANRGLIRLVQGRNGEAQEDFDQALRLDPRVRPRLAQCIKALNQQHQIGRD